MLPCVTDEGKVIMEAQDRMAMAPDGNGGIFAALQRCTWQHECGIRLAHILG